MDSNSVSSPTVSVIIPTYNRSLFLKEAVNSVLAQTYRDFELIVVDDGSTDATGQVVASYGDQLRYIYQENQGRSAARNAGVKLARGRYIAFLDSDDIWHPVKLERQICVLESNPTLALLHCFTSVIDETGKNCPEATQTHQIHHQRNTQIGYTYAAIALECIMFTSCIVVRKSIFESVEGFDHDCEPLEDWDFYLRVAQQYKISVTPECLVFYRHHTNQSGEQNLTRARVAVCQKHLKGLQVKAELPQYKLAYRNLLIQLGESHFILGHYTEARQCLKRAVQLDFRLALQPIWAKHWILPHLILSSLPVKLTSRLRNIKYQFRKLMKAQL